MPAVIQNEQNTMIFLCTIDDKTKRQTVKAQSGTLVLEAESYNNFMKECDPLFDATAVKHKAQTSADVVDIPL